MNQNFWKKKEQKQYGRIYDINDDDNTQIIH